MSETISAGESPLKKNGKRKRKPFRLTAKKSTKCKICSRNFSTIATRNKHMLIHSDHKGYSCEICSKAFRRRDGMVQHLSTHFNGHGLTKQDLNSMPVNALCLQFEPIIKSKGFTCGTCSKVFSRKNQWKNHMITHSDLRPFCCQICSKAFKRRDSLRNHFGIYHPEYHQNFMEYAFIEEMNVGDIQKKFQCDICSKGFSTKDSVKLHLFAHVGLKPYTCKICSKGLRSRTRLRQHLRTHCEDE